MTSRHRDRHGVSVRTTADERDAANHALHEHGWTMADFLIASLRAVAHSPRDVLGLLVKHRPEPRPRGRPKRQPDQP